jgi:RNA-directed DNA polymerase
MKEKQETINTWTNYLSDIGLKDEARSKYLTYAKSLIEKGFPVIFEINHLAGLLGRNLKYVASVINATKSHYRLYSIPKRRGGFREISAPYPALLECQKWINDNILSKVNVHYCAHGYVKNKSIITNATPHLSQESVLKIDLEDFFPSITIEKVISVFKRCGYSQNVALYLAKICCLENKLPQGAATSPTLSNIITFKLDKRLSGISQKFKLKYTRYADDLTFSGHNITIKTIEIIKNILNDQGFKINEEKTKLCRSKGKRIVTGLSVTGTSLKIPNTYKRRLRQELHYISQFGYFSHVSHEKIRRPFYFDSVYGKLRFWNLIEPENRFALTQVNKLQNLIKSIK